MGQLFGYLMRWVICFCWENQMVGKKILIVEDEKEMLDLLAKRLAKEGYQVMALSQGQQVVAKTKEFQPQLILMDIMLPDIDGAEAVKLLQQDGATSGIPVVFLSGIVSPDEKKQISVKVGLREYPALPKPFTAEQLLIYVKRQVG